MNHDLAVIGSGSAAFAAAIRARDLGKRVLLIERGTIGGTCVNVGCIPSKALIAAATQHWQSSQNRFPGLHTSSDAPEFAQVMSGIEDIVGVLRHAKYEDLAEEHGIEILRGDARFTSPDALDVDGTAVTATAYLIATGSKPHVPAIDGLAESGYLTSTTLLELQQMPGSLAVLGAGYVGLELAQALARLGSRVTIIARSTVTRHEEPPIRQALADYLRREGVTILESTRVTAVEREGALRRLHLLHPDAARSVVDADQILVATGRTPSTEQLGTELAGIKTTLRGAVAVDQHMQTTNPRVWGAGDCCDVPQFVYVAAQMGTTAAQNALSDSKQLIDWSALPRITFTDPTLAAVGLTEAQAREQEIDCRSHTMDLTAASRPWVNRDMRGVIRLVVTRDTERVIGASILAPHAEDLILAAQLAVRHKLTLTDLQTAWTPYLTLGEALKLAAVSFDRDPRKLSCCA